MRTCRVPLGDLSQAPEVRANGMGGHLEDHNDTANQVFSLWLETESLHREVDRLRFWIIVLAVLILGLGICLAFIA